jgi:NADH-quinone oxidoreductase subunit J
MQTALAKLVEQGLAVRNQVGTLKPDENARLSSFSGTPANAPVNRDAAGNAPLPAENVAYLGRSLYADYLLAVELGGTLLLVATVGAIAIASRGREDRP